MSASAWITACGIGATLGLCVTMAGFLAWAWPMLWSNASPSDGQWAPRMMIIGATLALASVVAMGVGTMVLQLAGASW